MASNYSRTEIFRAWMLSDWCCWGIWRVLSGSHTKHLNTLCGGNVRVLNVKSGVTLSTLYDRINTETGDAFSNNTTFSVVLKFSLILQDLLLHRFTAVYFYWIYSSFCSIPPRNNSVCGSVLLSNCLLNVSLHTCSNFSLFPQFCLAQHP